MDTFNHVVLWLRAYSIVPMFAVFLLILLATYWPSRRKMYEHDAAIPLHDDR